MAFNEIHCCKLLHRTQTNIAMNKLTSTYSRFEKPQTNGTTTDSISEYDLLYPLAQTVFVDPVTTADDSGCTILHMAVQGVSDNDDIILNDNQEELDTNQESGESQDTQDTNQDPHNRISTGAVIASSFAGGGLSGIVGAVGTYAAAIPVVNAIGFTSAGIASGSSAAGLMSSYAIANGGGVAAGGLVATLQSIGAVGALGATGTVVVAGVGAVVGVGLGLTALGIGYGGYRLYKHYKKPSDVNYASDEPDVTETESKVEEKCALVDVDVQQLQESPEDEIRL